MAEEDLYFARRDKELIAANKQRAEARKQNDVSVSDASSIAKRAEDSKIV